MIVAVLRYQLLKATRAASITLDTHYDFKFDYILWTSFMTHTMFLKPKFQYSTPNLIWWLPFLTKAKQYKRNLDLLNL